MPLGFNGEVPFLENLQYSVSDLIIFFTNPAIFVICVKESESGQWVEWESENPTLDKNGWGHAQYIVGGKSKAKQGGPPSSDAGPVLYCYVSCLERSKVIQAIQGTVLSLKVHGET